MRCHIFGFPLRLLLHSKQAVRNFGEMSWKLIAQQVPTRSHVQCLQRWKKALDPRLVKGPWSEEEDQLLVRSGPTMPCKQLAAATVSDYARLCVVIT